MLIGVVTAKFNSEFTFELERGAIEALKQSGLSDAEIWNVRVPGAIEIPLAAQSLLQQGCDGVVVLGVVIRGDTAHFDYVCQSVERGITHLMLEFSKPIGFGVLTTETEEQAQSRTTGHHGNKGAEAALTTLEMVRLLSEIKSKKIIIQILTKNKKPESKVKTQYYNSTKSKAKKKIATSKKMTIKKAISKK